MKRCKLSHRKPGAILVIATRRIGDVLLTTPVLRSLRQAYRTAKIDIVVFEGTEGCLTANRDIDKIIAVREGAPLREQLRTVRQLFRRYDLAVSTLSGDRPIFYAWMAGKECIGPVEKGSKHLWKRLLLDRHVLFDNVDTHTVTMNLSILAPLDIRQIPEVMATWTEEEAGQARQLLPFDADQEPYAVVHVYPKFSYKMWHQEGWIKVIGWLKSRGFRIVLTGGKGAEELAYISQLCRSLPVDNVNVAGKLSLGGVAYLLSRARVYVGLDTAVTHMSAALGIPTIALYGPTNPVKWGPLPRSNTLPAKSPYRRKGPQLVENVFLVQGKDDCVPCHEEGCERNINSSSKCLQNIDASEVIAAIKELLPSERH